jgi:hypothetical protein
VDGVGGVFCVEPKLLEDIAASKLTATLRIRFVTGSCHGFVGARKRTWGKSCRQKPPLGSVARVGVGVGLPLPDDTQVPSGTPKYSDEQRFLELEHRVL